MHEDMFKAFNNNSFEYNYPYRPKEDRRYLSKKYKVNRTINGNIENTIQLNVPQTTSTLTVIIKSYRYDELYKVSGVEYSSPLAITIPANTLGAGIAHIVVTEDDTGTVFLQTDLKITN